MPAICAPLFGLKIARDLYEFFFCETAEKSVSENGNCWCYAIYIKLGYIIIAYKS